MFTLVRQRSAQESCLISCGVCVGLQRDKSARNTTLYVCVHVGKCSSGTQQVMSKCGCLFILYFFVSSNFKFPSYGGMQRCETLPVVLLSSAPHFTSSPYAPLCPAEVTQVTGFLLLL